MESILGKSDFEEFWIRLYFNTKVDFIDAAINRAYRDFNRTQTGLAEKKKADSYSKFKGLLRTIIEELLSNEFSSQASFDVWHKVQCEKLIHIYSEVLGFGFSVGQAQKWINMTLKYLFAFGENRVLGISKNYEFFHIPIDNIIQDKLQKDKKIEKITQAWSRINDYEIYLDYQMKVRRAYSGQIPMDVEFKLFNQVS